MALKKNSSYFVQNLHISLIYPVFAYLIFLVSSDFKQLKRIRDPLAVYEEGAKSFNCTWEVQIRCSTLEKYPFAEL